MKILRIIKKEVLPLNGQQQIILLLIITSVFQFVLFYTPVLADQAVKQAQSNSQEVVVSQPIIKNVQPQQLTNKFIGPKISDKVQILSSQKIVIKVQTKAKVKIKKKRTVTKVLRTSTHIITAYNSEVDQTDNTPCTTANGFNVCRHNREDTIAVNFLKFGTKVKIPELFGNRIFIVRDRMNKRNSNRVDVWMKTRSQALKFGRRIAKIQVVQVIN